jgi:hypothetical protein
MHRDLACAAVALAALATPSPAASRPFVADPRGDWPVPSQDIVSGTIATDRAGRVVVGMRLAAPLAQLPGNYQAVFYHGECGALVARLEWHGTALPHTSALDVTTWCGSPLTPYAEDPRPQVHSTLPAAVAIAGDTVTWTLPAIPELAKGTLLKWPYVVAAPTQKVIAGVYVMGLRDEPPVAVEAFDIARAGYDYVVGSRPR